MLILYSPEISRKSWKVSEQGMTLYNLCGRKPTLSKCDGLTRKGKMDAEENHTWSKPQMVFSGRRDRWGLRGAKATVPWINTRQDWERLAVISTWSQKWFISMRPVTTSGYSVQKNVSQSWDTLWQNLKHQSQPKKAFFFFLLTNNSGNWSLNLATYREQQISYINNVSLASCFKRKKKANMLKEWLRHIVYT